MLLGERLDKRSLSFLWLSRRLALVDLRQDFGSSRILYMLGDASLGLHDLSLVRRNHGGLGGCSLRRLFTNCSVLHLQQLYFFLLDFMNRLLLSDDLRHFCFTGSLHGGHILHVLEFAPHLADLLALLLCLLLQ